MTAMVCTAWYRPPELWALTMGENDVGPALGKETTPYGFSLDVWSFGAFAYEALSGATLANRAGNGAAMVRAVAGVIGACPATGPGAPEYAQCRHWKSWAAGAKPGRGRALPESGAR